MAAIFRKIYWTNYLKTFEVLKTSKVCVLPFSPFIFVTQKNVTMLGVLSHTSMSILGQPTGQNCRTDGLW